MADALYRGAQRAL
jgi:hypothetical protein